MEDNLTLQTSCNVQTEFTDSCSERTELERLKSAKSYANGRIHKECDTGRTHSGVRSGEHLTFQSGNISIPSQPNNPRGIERVFDRVKSAKPAEVCTQKLVEGPLQRYTCFRRCANKIRTPRVALLHIEYHTGPSSKSSQPQINTISFPNCPYKPEFPLNKALSNEAVVLFVLRMESRIHSLVQA